MRVRPQASVLSAFQACRRLENIKGLRYHFPFLREKLSFEPSEPPSRICLVQVPRNSLYAEKENIAADRLLP